MSDLDNSDEDNDQQADMSSESIQHDDFEYSTMFDDLSKEAPQMDTILGTAKHFGNAHRHLINKFVFEASMRTKKMNLIFAKYVTTVMLKKHPEAVMKIQATPEDSRELSKLLVKTMNKEKGKSGKSFAPWRFVISSDEKTPNEYVTMTGCSQNSTIISEASDMKKEERALLLAILEEMMKGDGFVKMTTVHRMTESPPCKMVGTKFDAFLTRMARLKYFQVDGEAETLEITPRILVELEPWLRAKLVGELKICDLCRKIIARPTYTAECSKCKALSHFNCFKNATVISKKDSIECQKCKAMIKLDEVTTRMESRKPATRRPAPRQSRSQSKKNSESDADDVATGTSGTSGNPPASESDVDS